MEERCGEGGEAGALTVKVSIATHVRLADTISDYLVGVFNAAVEFGVDEDSTDTVVHGFLQFDPGGTDQLNRLERQVADYAADMAAIFQLPPPRVSSEFVPAQDWSRNWKKHFKSFAIIPGLVIAPSWEHYIPTGADQVIVMDPGMAFGTGHHATTRLCLRLIKASMDETPVVSVLDVGTGTGILGMAAVLFGATQVTGIDNDSDAVAAAADNVRRNRLENAMQVMGRPLARVAGTYQLVVANIIHDVLAELAEELARVTAKQGVLVLSGLLCGTQTENISRLFRARGFELMLEEREGEWGALKLKKK